MFLSSEQSGNIFWLAALITTFIVSSNGHDFGPVEIVEQFKIVPVIYDHLKTLLEPGHIHGGRQCGVFGKVLAIQQSGCITGSNMICSRIVDIPDKVGIIFIPSENINDVVTRISVTTQDGKVSSRDVPVDGVNLIAGQTYQFTMSIIMKSELKNKIFTGRLEIFSRSNYRARICSEVDLFVREQF